MADFDLANQSAYDLPLCVPVNFFEPAPDFSSKVIYPNRDQLELGFINCFLFHESKLLVNFLQLLFCSLDSWLKILLSDKSVGITIDYSSNLALYVFALGFERSYIDLLFARTARELRLQSLRVSKQVSHF